MMLDGLMPFSIRSMTAIPEYFASLIFFESAAITQAQYGSDIPSASVKHAIVLAVPIPKQPPAVSQMHSTSSSRFSALSALPFLYPLPATDISSPVHILPR